MIFIFLITFILLIMIFLMPINIVIKYKYIDKKNETNIYFKTMLGLINYNVNIPYLKGKIEKINRKGREKHLKRTTFEDIDTKKTFRGNEELTIDEVSNKFHSLLISYKKTLYIAKYFINMLLIKKLKININYDLEDSALTGLITGILYSVQSILLLKLAKCDVEEINIDLNPLFIQKNILDINICCIIQFKLGQIIYGLIKTIIINKEADISWQNNIQ